MPDLYGNDVGLGGLSLENAGYLPTLYPAPPSVQDYLDQFRAEVPQPPAPAPAAPSPAIPLGVVGELTPSQLQAVQTYLTRRAAAQQPKAAEVKPAEAKAEAKPETGTLGMLSSVARQTAAEAKAGIAAARGDVEGLIAAQQESEAARKAAPAEYQAFTKATGEDTGSLWGYLSNVAQQSLKNKEGAYYAFTGMLAGFLPYMGAGIAGGAAGSVVGPIGSVVGAAAGMGLTSADLEAGSKALQHLQLAAQKDGIDLSPGNGAAVAKWLKETGAEQVFGPAVKAGLTSGAITAATMALTGPMGKYAAEAATRSGMLATERAAAGTLVGPQAPEALQAALQQRARQAAVGSAVGNVAGFGGASVAADIAAGDTPDERDMLVNALTLAIPSYFHARGIFKATKPGEVPKAGEPAPEAPPTAEPPKLPPAPTEEELRNIVFPAGAAEGEAAKPLETTAPEREARAAEREAPMSVEEQQAAYEKYAADNKLNLDSTAGVREALDAPTLKKQLDDEIAAVASAKAVPDKIDRLEALAQAGDERGGKYGARVAERAQALADELKARVGETPEPRTLEEAIQARPEEAQNVTAATMVAHDVMKDVANEIIAEVKAETQSRKAQAAAPATTAEVPGAGAAGAPIIGFARTGRARSAAEPTVPAAAKLPTLKRGRVAAEGAGEPAGNVEAIKGAGNFGQEQVGTPAGAGVNAQVLHAGATLKPRRGKSARGPGGNVEPAAAGPVVPRGNEPGKGTAGAGVKLRAGRAATEEANRKAEADIKAALESERLGPEEQAGPEAKIRSMDEVLRDYNYRVKQVQNRLDLLNDLQDSSKGILVLAKGIRSEEGKARVERLNAEMEGRAERIKEEEQELQRLQAERRTQMQVADDLRQQQFTRALDRLVDAGHISKEQEPFYRALAGGQTRSALDYIQQHASNPVFRQLAKFLKQMRVVPEARFADPYHKEAAGEYWAETDKLNLDAGAYLQQARDNKIDDAMYTFLHETVHGGTVNALSKAWHMRELLKQPRDTLSNEDIKYSQSEEYKAAENIFKTFDYLKQKFPFTFEERQLYGAKNPLELVAEVFVNKKLQDYLRNITLPKEITGASKVMDAWHWFISSVRKLLGVEDKGIDNALANIIQNTTALVRARRGVEVGKFGPYTPEFNVLPATTEEILGRRLINVQYGSGDVTAQVKADQAKAEAEHEATARTPHDAIIGLNEEGRRTHVAYRRGDNDYDLYPVTAEIPRGDPAGKQTGLTEEQVHQAIRDEGSDSQLASGDAFARPPGNDDQTISRWKDGKLVYMAIKNRDGTWTSKAGDDLQNMASGKTTGSYPDREGALAAARQASDYSGRDQSLGVMRAQETKNLIEKAGGKGFVLATPSKLMESMLDGGAYVRYLAQHMDVFLQSLGIRTPADMQLNTAFLLKNSDIIRRTSAMVQNEAEPLMAKARTVMKQRNLDKNQLGSIIGDLVVAERNPKLRKIYTDEAIWKDPNDHSQGHTTFYEKNVKAETDAVSRLNALDPATKAAVQQLMGEWKKFSDATVDLRRDAGVLTPDAAARIKAAYTIYAPLGEKKSRNAKATGQSATTTNPLERMVEARSMAIMEDVDNNAKRMVAQIARSADIRTPTGERMFKVTPVDAAHLKHDVESGQIKVSTALDNTKSFVAYEGGIPVRIEVADSVADKFIKALEPFKGAERDTVLQKMIGGVGFFTRMFGALHTSLSTPFAVRNFARDYVTNLSQLDPRIGYGKFHAAMINPEVISAAFRHGFHELAKVAGKDSLAGSQLAQDVERDGALIGHKSRYGVDQITADVKTALPSPGALGKLKTGYNVAREYASPSDGKLTNFFSGLTHSLEAWNRIAVYKAARESGIAPREAGVLAKDSTTNFELRGQWMPYVSPLYAFANAKMQGARTVAEKLGFTQFQGAERGGIKQGLKGLVPFMPKAASANARTIRAAQLMVALGLVSGYANYKTSEKDKAGRTLYGKRNEYQLDEYLHIPGTNIDLPIPQEIGSFYNVGSSLSDKLWGDRAGAASSPGVRFATAMIQNFWPGGTSMHDPVGTQGEGLDYAARLVTPTVMLPFYDVSRNMDTFGRAINPQRESKTIPPEYQGAKSATPLANTLARSAAQAGLESSPKAWDHIFDAFFKQQHNSIKSIITNGPVGGLLQNTFKSFEQQVYPGTNKNDYDQIAKDIAMGNYRAKGGPLKKGERDSLQRLFDSTTTQINALGKEWAKATTEEQKQRISSRQDDLRLRALKRYYEATGIVTAQQ